MTTRKPIIDMLGGDAAVCPPRSGHVRKFTITSTPTSVEVTDTNLVGRYVNLSWSGGPLHWNTTDIGEEVVVSPAASYGPTCCVPFEANSGTTSFMLAGKGKTFNWCTDAGKTVRVTIWDSDGHAADARGEL